MLRAGGIGDVDISPVPELVELYLRMGAADTARGLAATYQDRAAAKGLPWAWPGRLAARGSSAAKKTWTPLSA